MSASATLTLRLEPELKEQLDQLSRSTKRSKSFLAAEAIRNFISTNAWQVDAIKNAVEQANNGGPFVAHEDVAAWVESWDTENELPRPKSTKM
ncbi:MAG: CopG family ribbon-helix-helix protein [Magnetococcales bacterium]|nr:CopG family ribbon-helix-helix protein [Magnetococcales bacterium]